MPTGTVTLHRVLTASLDKVYRAFSDPLAYATWIPPYGFLCEVHESDFRESGRFKMSFVNFTTGKSHSFGGVYEQIIPNEFIKYSDTFDDPNLSGNICTTVALKALSCGTEICIVQSGIPEAIPTEMCYLGWQDSLDKLKRLVEPNIPDES